MQLHGIHHVTAVTGDAPANLDFYTRVLGLRLVKKTVNQDDTSAYHLFYADKLGSPGTDMTFFDWPQTAPNRRGSDSISRTMFRVSGRAALDYWQQRLDAHGVQHGSVIQIAGRDWLRFSDPEGQALALVDDGGAAFEGEVWDGADIPEEHAIRGFFGVEMAVSDMSIIELILTRVLNMTLTERQPDADNPAEERLIFSMDGGGPGREVHVLLQPTAAQARLGRGGVHHVAFRLTDDEEQAAWEHRLADVGLPHSGQIDRYYFKSVYFRISRGILFELATDGPGFATDESPETLGERLALPPFLESQRAQIEARLKPLA